MIFADMIMRYMHALAGMVWLMQVSVACALRGVVDIESVACSSDEIRIDTVERVIVVLKE
jgi:hypothetical protein